MPSLEIPEEYQVGLTALIKLNNESFQELIAALESAPFALKHTTIVNSIASKVTTLSHDNVEEVIDLLVALNIVRGDAPVTTAEFVDDVYEAVEDFDEPEFDLSNESRDQFKQRLAQLLDCKSLGVASKTRLLQREYERRYCSARIVTDIRPIFSSDIETQPIAAVVMHTLRVKYHQDDDLREVFVALKADDLEELKGSIERAETKAASLRTLLDAANVSYLE
jgi:hypothetical protein